MARNIWVCALQYHSNLPFSSESWQVAITTTALQWNKKHILPRSYPALKINELPLSHIDYYTEIRSHQKEDWFSYDEDANTGRKERASVKEAEMIHKTRRSILSHLGR